MDLKLEYGRRSRGDVLRIDALVVLVLVTGMTDVVAIPHASRQYGQVAGWWADEPAA